MSSQELKKYVIKFNREMAAGKWREKRGRYELDPEGRAMAQKQEGQVFILPKELVFNSLDLTTQALGLSDIPSQEKTIIIRKLRAWFTKTSTQILTGKYKGINIPKKHLPPIIQNYKGTIAELRSRGKIPRGAIVAFIRSFNQVNEWKKGGTNLKPGGPADIVATAILKHDDQAPTEEDDLLEQRSAIASVWGGNVQTAHGEFGRAATQIHVGRASNKAWEGVDRNKLTTSQIETIESVMINMDNTLTSAFTHEMALDSNGNFKKEYMTVNSWQLGGTNQAEAVIEGSARRAALKTINSMPIVEGEASISLIDAIERVLLYAMTNKTKKSGAKVRITGAKPAKNIKTNSEAKGIKKFKSKHKVGIIKTIPFNMEGIARVVSKRAKKEKNRGPELNLATMLTILNQKINKTVQGNMGFPSLRNRTGTFAGSVQIKNILPGPNPTAQYSYDRFRYGRFEGTEPWSDGGNRDPRRLIERSIREITTEHAMGRFLTQRI